MRLSDRLTGRAGIAHTVRGFLGIFGHYKKGEFSRIFRTLTGARVWMHRGAVAPFTRAGPETAKFRRFSVRVWDYTDAGKIDGLRAFFIPAYIEPPTRSGGIVEPVGGDLFTRPRCKTRDGRTETAQDG